MNENVTWKLVELPLLCKKDNEDQWECSWPNFGYGGQSRWRLDEYAGGIIVLKCVQTVAKRIERDVTLLSSYNIKFLS